MRLFLFMAFGLALAGCVETEPYLAKTPSGRPEVRFSTSNLSSVSDKLVKLCVDKGLLAQSASPSQVVCGGTMQGGDAVLAQIAIGNSYSTTPSRYVRFTLFKDAGQVRVQAYQWIETQMAFGQVNRAELNGSKQFNDVLRALISIGGKPVGAIAAPS